MKKMLFVFGTRPEAIKMAPVILEAKKQKIPFKICVTAQHRELLDQVLDLFQIQTDYDLNLMSQNQGLFRLSSLILEKIEQVLDDYMPDLVLVHGDTITTSIVALSSFYKKINIGHIEAGLRSGDIYSPWPEEGNRRLVTALASLHFAPTTNSYDNLVKENIPTNSVCITGNTVIDALIHAVQIIDRRKSLDFNIQVTEEDKLVVVTCHRRENFGLGIKNICHSIKRLSLENANLKFVISVHPNPNIKSIIESELTGFANIELRNSFDYIQFISILKRSDIILTDSGGIQEEAPSLGKPILLLRDKTERPEGIESGNVLMVGSDSGKIVYEVNKLIRDDDYYKSFSKNKSPYGDGKASEKIIKKIIEFFDEN
jgi:UDP-N-acetylglucosamine 2-epimerase (non-hydrolysing)